VDLSGAGAATRPSMTPAATAPASGPTSKK
jgi:hypothetical protein